MLSLVTFFKYSYSIWTLHNRALLSLTPPPPHCYPLPISPQVQYLVIIIIIIIIININIIIIITIYLHVHTFLGGGGGFLKAEVGCLSDSFILVLASCRKYRLESDSDKIRKKWLHFSHCTNLVLAVKEFI